VRRRIALLAMLAAGLSGATPRNCAECHAGIAASYARTGMGRSFQAVLAGTKLPDFDGAKFSHPPSREDFIAFEKDGKNFVRRSQQGSNMQGSNIFEEQVDYAIGSGNHAISYLHRRRDNQLIEFPVTWYAENRGHWGISPAYDRPDHAGFSRTISFRCMFCHNAYPDSVPGAADIDSGSVFPASLPEGIDCQRCHGDGAKHIDAARNGRPMAEVRAGIVNPSRLNLDRQLDVCMQCHLETTSLPLPGALPRIGRSVYSYKPGEPLADYMRYFDYAPGSGRENDFDLVSSAYRLRQSACFRASGGKLTCTTCHDPHVQPAREVSIAKTNAVCGSCHAAIASTATHPGDPDCVSCHMPLRPAEDAIHIAMTDHRIARKAAAPPANLVERQDGNVPLYAGPVVPYYPETAISPDIYFEMGESRSGVGQSPNALRFYREASKRDPDNWRYLYGLGRALQAGGEPDNAISPLQRAVTLAPGETGLLEALGSAYAASRHLPDAIATFRIAIERDPESAAAFHNLGNALLLSGGLRGAETALREAVRLQPEIAAMRMSLADVLTRNGKLREAAAELREAIRTGPSTGSARAAAHTNLGTVYISLGDAASAIAEYRLAVQADANSVTALMNLGFTLAQHGDATEARQRLSLALRLDPTVKADLQRAAASADKNVSAIAADVLKTN
jgi:predicted CXXCH cytochrome family protein